MTLTAFIKKLEKIKKTHGGRVHVTVDVNQFKSVSDDYSHFDVSDIGTDCIRYEKDDSYFLADGSERMRVVVVLS